MLQRLHSLRPAPSEPVHRTLFVLRGHLDPVTDRPLLGKLINVIVARMCTGESNRNLEASFTKVRACCGQIRQFCAFMDLHPLHLSVKESSPPMQRRTHPAQNGHFQDLSPLSWKKKERVPLL